MTKKLSRILEKISIYKKSVECASTYLPSPTNRPVLVGQCASFACGSPAEFNGLLTIYESMFFH